VNRVYIFPYADTSKSISKNPYINDLVESLRHNFIIVNEHKANTRGIFDIFSYIFKIDYLYLNWIENLQFRRFGYIQALFFIILVPFFKYLRIEIIWTLHNKYTHSQKKYMLNRILTKLLIYNSDYIITHSSEGISFIQKISLENLKKVKYLPHPIKNRIIKRVENPAIDILIWGSIDPYKGIHDFLNYLFVNHKESLYNIHIVGKFSSRNYYKQLMAFSAAKIKIQNKYITNVEVEEYIRNSKVVLFTYNSRSILSSGALMDTLSYGAQIIGPNIGAFKDMQKLGLIKTYNHYEEIIDILNHISDIGQDNKCLLRFIENNGWNDFSCKILKLIN